MDNTPLFTFSSLESSDSPSALSTQEIKEQLSQYNLDKNLRIQRFRFHGGFINSSTADYEQLIKDFFSSSTCTTAMGVSGSPSVPVDFSTEQSGTFVMNMGFFDKLTAAGYSPCHILRFLYNNVLLYCRHSRRKRKHTRLLR